MVAVLAACGDDGGDDSPSSSTGANSDDAKVIIEAFFTLPADQQAEICERFQSDYDDIVPAVMEALEDVEGEFSEGSVALALLSACSVTS